MFKSARTVAVYVSDLEEAKRFYTEILGFRVRVQLTPTLCFLESREPGIDLYLEGGNSPSIVRHDMARLSFFLETEGSVFEALDRLKAAGVMVLNEAPVQVGDETWTFQFEDPDGNILDACGPA